MHTFRAWIDEEGGNEDYEHAKCEDPWSPCDHLRLVDLDTDNCRCIVRIVWRRRPLYFSLRVGPRYWQVLRVGRKPR